MAEADKFEPPIKFTAPGLPGEIIISSESDLDSFVTAERNVWQEFLGRIPQAHQAIAQARANQQNWLQGLSNNLNGFRSQQANSAQRANSINGIRNALMQIQQGQALYSKSPAAAALFELAKQDPQAAGIRLARLLGQAGVIPQGQPRAKSALTESDWDSLWM